MKSIPPSIFLLRDNFGEKRIEREDVIEIFMRYRSECELVQSLTYRLCDSVIGILNKNDSKILLLDGTHYLPSIRFVEIIHILDLLEEYSEEHPEPSPWEIRNHDSGPPEEWFLDKDIKKIKRDILMLLRRIGFDIDEDSFKFASENSSELIRFFNQKP
jgi:hypothetical protein